MMKKIIPILFLLYTITGNAQNNMDIVPMPAEMNIGKGFCIVKEPVGFILIEVEENDTDKNDGVEFFKSYLKKKYGINKFIEGDTHSYGLPTEIFFTRTGKKQVTGYYELEVTGNKIYISGTALGKFYAFETLKQLITINKKKQIVIPNCKIKDYPRFPYRGMHLDVGRHFFPVDFIKKYIDHLSAYKFNTFHWHLTDDQGWRIEIKKYPLLTQVGSCREKTLTGNYGSNKYDGIKYCGYYTREQIKEVVKYAADRYITVIPEIEMPGHCMAALASYPNLGCTKGPYKVLETWGISDDVFCAGNDSTYEFIENVLDEVLELFPSKFIHTGGDECPKERWKTCAVCQKRIKDERLKDENELQSYFVKRIEKYLNSKGRNIIGWDEILDGGLASNATIMSWRGEEGGIAAARQNHDAIMTPGSHCYLDYSQSINEDSLTIGGYIPLEKVYGYEPIPPSLNALEAKHILGAQGNVWTEYITNPSKVEYMIFPRIAALSEVLWTPAKKRNWNDFERRLPVIFERLNKEKTNYSKAYYEPKIRISPTPDFEGVHLTVKSTNDRLKYYFGNKTESKFSIYSDSINTIIKKQGVYGIRMLGKLNPAAQGEQWGSARLSPFEYIFSADIKVSFNKATGKKIILANEPAVNYPGDGAFTLVNGIQNEKGLARSAEFLGFLTNCEATIDLGKTKAYSKIIVHALRQEDSWIWQPISLTVFGSPDGIHFTSMGLTRDFVDTHNNNGTMTIHFNTTTSRYLKVIIENKGKIPDGKQGAGYPAWLFVDEIEVE